MIIGKDQTIQVSVIDKKLLDPLNLFVHEMKDKNFKRLAIEEIQTIALALGQKRTRNELIPLIGEHIIKQNNEIRVLLINQLPKLVDYIGQNWTHLILELTIDLLCIFSEPQIIRSQAFQCLQTIFPKIEISVLQNQLVDIIQSLSQEIQSNIKEVTIRLVRLVYGSIGSQNQLRMLKVIGKYKEKEKLIFLGKEMKQLVKLLPEEQVRQILKIMLQSENSKIRSLVILSLIQFSKINSEEPVEQMFIQLLNDSSAEVVSSVIMQTKDINIIFPQKLVQKLLSKIDLYGELENIIKNSIVEVLEHIPLTEERRKLIIYDEKLKQLNLKRNLANSLCKLDDVDGLLSLLRDSDNEFKIKLFPKLPSVSELHVVVLGDIFGQKNWRGKLTILQNLQTRLQKQQPLQCLIPFLFGVLSDKIAIVRTEVASFIARILYIRKLHINKFKNQIQSSFQSKNWQQRQNVLRIIENMLSFDSEMDQTDYKFIQTLTSKAKKQKIANIQFICANIDLQLLKIKSKKNH